jgi:hypothetical protein|nr:MAG TPA: Lysostaphin [Caudoviricetes sp.]
MRKYNIGICLIALITMLYLGTNPLIATVTSIIIYIINKFPDKQK